MLAEYLQGAGLELWSKATGASGLDLLASGDFDALILDVMLPDCDGFEVCRKVRARSEIPILMLTARGDETDRIVGLELGADDYLPKPLQSPRTAGKAACDLAARAPPGGQLPSAAIRSARSRLRCANRSSRRRRTITDQSPVRLDLRTGRELRSRHVARYVDATSSRPEPRRLRSQYRRSHFSNPRGHRGRPQEAAPCDHGPRCRICVGQAARRRN